MLARTRLMASGFGWASLLGLALGCGASYQVSALEPSVEAPAAARVSLTEIDENIFKFIVHNLSNVPLVILRDNVLLRTPVGIRRRAPGGLSHVYNVPPGGAHELNVKFDLSGLAPGDHLEVQFEQALLIGGLPTLVPPMRFQYTE